MDGERRTFTIYANDQLTRAAEYDNLVIAYRNGAPVRVRDIGHAVDEAENVLQSGFESNHPAVVLVIFKQPNANVIDTVERIKAAMPRLLASIPPAVNVSLVMDRTQTIRASVHDVQFTLMLSVALVVMVIFVFLRNAWATIIPERDAADRPGRHLRRHVPDGLQPRQFVADGADHRGGVRGR